MLSGFGRMLFKGSEAARVKGDEEVVKNGAYSGFSFSISSVFNNSIMILLASLIVVFGLTVPGFIDGTIRTCIYILGVK